MNCNPNNTRKYAAVVFDCDGVIFDSNSLKTEAFRKVLSTYPNEIVDKFIAYHQIHGGISRYVKFRVFYSEFLQINVEEIFIDKQIAKYGESCRELYKNAILTPGCREVLEVLARKYPLYIASGGAEDELRDVFGDKGLTGYFKKIFGSPKKKKEILGKIVNLEKTRQIIFVGDAYADLEAAKQEGLPFIFMSQFSDAKDDMLRKSKDHGFTVINTLKDLKRML